MVIGLSVLLVVYKYLTELQSRQWILVNIEHFPDAIVTYRTTVIRSFFFEIASS